MIRDFDRVREQLLQAFLACASRSDALRRSPLDLRRSPAWEEARVGPLTALPTGSKSFLRPEGCQAKIRYRAAMSLTYSVRLGSLAGRVLGTYRHPGPDEPRRGTVLSPQGGLEGGPWRVSDYV